MRRVERVQRPSRANRLKGCRSLGVGRLLDLVAQRTPGPVQQFGFLGPDVGAQVVQLLKKDGRLDRYTLNRLAAWSVRTHYHLAVQPHTRSPCGRTCCPSPGALRSRLRSLDLSTYSRATNDILAAVERCMALISLSLEGAPFVTDAGLAHLSGRAPTWRLLYAPAAG